MVMKWPWRKIGGLESGFVCAAMAATGFAIWKKDDTDTDTVHENLAKHSKCPAQQTNIYNNSTVSTIETYESRLKNSITKAKDLCQIVKDECGLPGLVVAVSVNGKLVWEDGFGYADVENRVLMKPDTVLRIASISKSMTMAMLGKLIEDGKINLDCPIQTYLPNFPKKSVDGEKVTITTRQLLSHLSGIRHYAKKGEQMDGPDNSTNEFFIKEKCDTIDRALQIFQNDELHHKPGTKYLYTTHGWTVVSAIIEKLTETPFPKYATKMFNFWGLKNTFLDEHEELVYHRGRYYSRNEHGRLFNSPYVDNSCKWAGGGFQSNVTDLIQFAHILLASFQYKENDNTKEFHGLPNKPYMKPTTIQQLWTPNPIAFSSPDSDFRYGMGFSISEPMRKCLYCKHTDMMRVVHTGGAVGSSSILYMAFPKDFRFGIGYDEVDDDNIKYNKKQIENKICLEEETTHIKGIVIAMITNLTDISLSNTANEIANVFKWMI